MNVFPTRELRQWIICKDGLCGIRANVDGVVECEPAIQQEDTSCSDTTPYYQLPAASGDMMVSLVNKYWQQLVVQQICDLGWHLIRKVSSDLTEISIDACSASYPNAILIVRLSADYPLKCPVIQADPLRLVPNHFASHHTFTLTHIRKEYLKDIACFEPLLQQLRNIEDKTLSVRGSAEPSLLTSDGNLLANVFVPISTERRVLVQYPHLHALIKLNPTNPNQQCTVSFAGPAELRRVYEVRWKDRSSSWDNTLSVLENLESILEVRFPSSREHTVPASPGGTLPHCSDAAATIGSPDAPVESSVECSICYSSAESRVVDNSSSAPKRRKLLDKQENTAGIPKVTCCNSKCNHVYHAACVRRWLASLSICKVSFGTMYGTCPYCASELQVSAV